MVLKHECDSLLCFSIGYEIILFYLFVGHVKILWEKSGSEAFCKYYDNKPEAKSLQPCLEKRKKKIKC